MKATPASTLRNTDPTQRIKPPHTGERKSEYTLYSVNQKTAVFGTLPAQALRRGQVGSYNKPRSLSKMTMRMITTRRPIIPGTFDSFMELFP